MNNKPVLIVGGTGHLGSKVVQAAREQGYELKALVRPGSDAGKLVGANVKIVHGDLLDRESLERALDGCDAVISTAIGYSNHRKGDAKKGIDTQGNQNLADAALAAGVRRLVFCSVLTCDKARSVPHFYNKKLAEDYFEEKGLPFVALRPGAFLDQGPSDFWAAGLKKGKLRFAANPDVPATFLHTSDLARYLTQAVKLEFEGNAERIDIGCDRPVSINQMAEIMSKLLGRSIKAQVPPWPVISTILGVAGLFDPWQHDLKAMMGYFQEGEYVADVTKQRKYFGEVPTIEASIQRYLDEVFVGEKIPTGKDKSAHKLEALRQ